ncbi:hypothetical protein MSG28_003478 [Choristoneura fumiferana]|uniref:Uncharacterized protein n=2 Tax=Choristoneura fumiferana TaxID=7141 RepID=A0ACC0KF36_CHOFU|nr:hypothetical protein MSG28_003478 [Choristoneura fumiferana]
MVMSCARLVHSRNSGNTSRMCRSVIMSNNYDDEQCEDGELARSPVQDDEDMDFSLSDEDRDNADSLVIKPPQAVIRPSHRDRRGHKRSVKDRYKDSSRKDKKHLYRDRDKSDKPNREISKTFERDDMPKEYHRDKQYFREKESYREKELRDKELVRERDIREKDIYREKDVYRDKDTYREKELYREKEPYREKDAYREKESYREKEQYREKEAYREKEIYREKEAYREKDGFRDKESYKEREHYREKEMYRDPSYREVARSREAYRDKDVQSQRDIYVSRERQYKVSDMERKRQDPERIESRLRLLAEDGHANHNNEKENRTTGEKVLEDLRSRLLNKRITKEMQSQDHKRQGDYSEKEAKQEKQFPLDKYQQERRNKLLEAEREMEKRKHESRNELEARREERRRRGKKRSASSEEPNSKKNKSNHSPHYGDSVVTVSDASDVDLKSDVESNSDPEEGEHSNTETEDVSSSTDSDSDVDSKSEDGEENRVDRKSDKEDEEKTGNPKQKSKSKSPPVRKSNHATPSSNESRRSRTRSKSRSRSHSFSPPPLGENGKIVDEQPPKEDEEQARLREEVINALPPYFPALQGCRSVEEFQCLNRIEEGTYGVVYRARDKTSDEIVALKRLKMEKEKEGFPITSLREINTLLKGQHPNIVTVREIVVGSNMDKIFIVMDYVEHDLKSLMETMRGKKQVGDFGLAREYGSPLRQYTPIVVTLWYRAPELLLCGKEYSTPIDMWSVGCIFAEFITMNPLFPGKSEVDQLNRIFKDLGTPSELVWPGYSELPAVQKMTFAEHPPGGLRARVGADLLSETGLSLLQAFLTYNPARRIAADAALEHAYFKEQPVAIEPAMFPTWPAKSEGNRRSTHSPRPPAGGAAYAQHADDELGFRVQPARSLNVAPGFSLKF